MARSFSYTEKLLRKKLIFIVILIFILMVLLYNTITHFVFRTYRIETETMQPTFHAGNIVAVTPLFSSESLKRGDIVYRSELYKSDLSFFQQVTNHIFSLFTANLVEPFESDRASLTKGGFFRVIGLPGDIIYLSNNIAYIKAQNMSSFLTEFELTDVRYDIVRAETKTGWKEEMPFSGYLNQVTLGEGEFFLLTDNRMSTLDSRLNGACKAESIAGKAILVTWPFSEWKSF